MLDSDARLSVAPHSLRARLAAPDVRHVLLLMFAAAVVLCGQIEHEVLYSVDGIAYALIGKELSVRPFSQWVILTWNGLPYYEHPHLTMWLLGASMRLFGVSTLAAILPIVLVALATVLLAYRLGRELLDHRLGLLAGTVLTLTPEFVRIARNPMLEAALMFFIMLALYFHIASTRPGAFLRGTILSGLSLGLAFLAKGPPALLVPGVIAGFQCAAHARPEVFNRLMLSWRRLALQLIAVVLISTAMVVFVELWHRAVAGTSYFAPYLGNQLRFTVIEGRGAPGNDWLFYAKIFFREWPWWPFVIGSGLLVAWKRDWPAVPALLLGGLVTVGTFLGFTLMTHKSEWYTTIHYAGSSLLAGLTLRYLIAERHLQRYYVPVVATLVIATLFLSASLPSLFLQYGRPFERFMEAARAELGPRLDRQLLGDCVSVESWRGPFSLRFYLGVEKVACDDVRARFKLVDTRDYVAENGDRLVFSQQPFAIVERASK